MSRLAIESEGIEKYLMPHSQLVLYVCTTSVRDALLPPVARTAFTKVWLYDCWTVMFLGRRLVVVGMDLVGAREQQPLVVVLEVVGDLRPVVASASG